MLVRISDEIDVGAGVALSEEAALEDASEEAGCAGDENVFHRGPGALETAALRGVAAVCPALNLTACADALEKTENYFYQQHFVAGLMARYARKAALFPEKYSTNEFGRIRTVREFDDVVTAPHCGYRDAADFAAATCAGNARGR